MVFVYPSACLNGLILKKIDVFLKPPYATSLLLGSDIHLFLARYGKPDVIQGAQYLYYKGVDLSVVHQGSASRVNTILITGNGTWNADQAKAACTPFIPQDAHSQRTYSSTSKSNGIAYTETSYLSPSLAQQLPADVFLNASAQPEAPGMFTMGLGHHKGSTNQFDDCYVSTSLVIL